MTTSPVLTRGRDSVPKFPFIDAIRGIAFLGVFICHASPVLEKLGCPQSLLRLSSQGGIGVQLFFIASALTLMLSLDSRVAERNPLRNFYLRRFFRIAPLYYLGILFYGLVFDGNSDPRSPKPLTLGSYLSNLTFSHSWNPSWINQLVPGGWSIGVEMTFYLIVPFLHAHLKRLGPTIVAMAVTYLVGFSISEATLAWLNRQGPPAVPGMYEAFTQYWFPYQLYRFFGGLVLYQVIRGRLERPTELGVTRGDQIRSAGWLGLSIVLLGVSLFGRLPKPVVSPICTVALIFFCGALSIFPIRLVVNTATRQIGKLSFSAYLTHFAAIFAVEKIFEIAGWATGSRNWLISNSVFLTASLILTLFASEILYRCIEKPGQAIGRRLITRLGSPGKPTSHPQSGDSTAHPPVVSKSVEITG